MSCWTSKPGLRVSHCVGMLGMGSQEVVTSPLLYKLTRLAQWCQRWPLVPDWDIICLCLWLQPPFGQGPVWELHCQAQEAAAPALSYLTPLSRWAVPRKRKGQSQEIGWVTPDLRRFGSFPLLLWKNCLGYLQRLEQASL